jgi:tripartite-type tricarboxylate transporter receptor subunit TctC
MMIDAIAATAPTVESGELRALGTTGSKRSSVLPDVPTMAKVGLARYEATIWLGIMAPAGTPAPILDTLNRQIIKVLQRPEMRAAWAKQGAWPLVMTPAEFDSYLRGDIEKWAKVIHTAGIRVQS